MITLSPQQFAAEPVAVLEGEALHGYEKYLTDESRRVGQAAALAFPRSTEEAVGAVRAARDRDLTLTVSGARTGIAAGAVPAGGMLVSLERMTRICGVRPAATDGEFLVRCQAGVSLADLQRAVRMARFDDAGMWDEESKAALEQMKGGRLFYPPDPTETSAALGGTVACNASGAHTFRYGPTRPYVEWLRVVLADGRVLDLRRGEYVTGRDGEFQIRAEAGESVSCRVPTYRWPDTKNSAGFMSGAQCDLLDLFVGSEGTLGIITEVEVRVVPAPEMSCAGVVFWADEDRALAFTRALRQDRERLGIEAIEYFGPNALALLRQRRGELGAASGVPECLPAEAGCAIYLDIGTDEAHLPVALQALAALVEQCGGQPALAWSALTESERERLRVFRHALPETVNARIAEIRRTHPGVTKLGTDMAVPGERLEQTVALYRTLLAEAGLEYVVFGHIGDGHLHVNILPRDSAEYVRGWELYHRFAREVVALGGSPAAEHGIGKLKTDFLQILYGADGLAQMLAVKRAFDPELRLGRGTLFEQGRDAAPPQSAAVEAGPELES